MAAVVIYEQNGNLRLKDFSLTAPNEISDIDFYVALAAKTKTQLFLILKDVETGIHEVVELHETTNSIGRPVFRVPLTYSLHLNKARVDMQLMILDVEAQTNILSKTARAYIGTQHYRAARETALVAELSDTMKAYYEAIIKALEKIVQKGENAE